MEEERTGSERCLMLGDKHADQQIHLSAGVMASGCAVCTHVHTEKHTHDLIGEL